MRTATAALAATISMIAALILASVAYGAFGDGYGMAPINDGTGPAEEAPAFPDTDNPNTVDNDADHAFWAGACEIATASPIGEDLTALGGAGTRPAQIFAPNAAASSVPVFRQSLVAAPPLPPHCIEWGAPGRLFDLPIWNAAPGWRLPPVTKAGAHGDGSASFTFARTPVGQIDGAVDNIYVDLPSGFVGNPNAVPKCTAEQFNGIPLQCPEESQVGVLHLEIQGAQFNSASNLDQVGALSEDVYPVYNLEPRTGRVAELGFAYASGERVANIRLTARARTNDDFGVTTFIGQIPAALPVIAQQITLWAVPWSAHNDRWRARDGYGPGGVCDAQPGTSLQNEYYIPPAGFATSECQAHYDPSWGDTPAERAIKPFLSNETDCKPGGQTVDLATDSYQHQGPFTAEGDPDLSAPTEWKTYSSGIPVVTDCAALGFGPDISFTPTTSAAEGASGLKVELEVPQNNLPPFEAPAPGAGQSEIDSYVAAAGAHWRSDAGRATAHLKDTVVTLPEGVSVNLSAAPGLRGCTDDQIGLRQPGAPPLFDNVDPTDGVGSPEAGTECPSGSKIGTVSVETPLLEQPLTGDVVLGVPKSTDPQSGEMFRLFLVLRDKERGLVAKIYGSTVADPSTGRLTTTFANNPEIPFEKLSLELKGGERGLLAMQQRCQSASWSSDFAPWSAAYNAGGQNVSDSGAFVTDSNCGYGFTPSLRAGMDRTQSGTLGGSFSFAFSRQDGEQWFKGLTAQLPTGLLGSVRDVPLCANAQADANACPAASRIGSVDAAAGSGDPFVLEKKGSVFLTEGYKGAPYGLAVSIPAEGGPFRDDLALTPVVVRQALHVDRRTAQVTAVSDPFPTVWHGLPLRVRNVVVNVDRQSFMRNPTDCSPKQIGAAILSTEGTVASPSNPFQASGCSALPFKPKLTLALTGKKQVRTGKHPGIKAQVTQQGVPEAGIQRAEVRLPKSLALDVNNAQALCEFADGTKPDLESHCPKGSIVGRARAVSPLLKQPLAGDVYFVKNVRIDPKTGNQIRTLPMIVVALRGEIAINLRGESAVTDDKLVNTFNQVPDAPITQFNLNIQGGSNGIIAVTRTRRSLINLCATGRQTAEADIDGQNGRRHDTDIAMRKPCTKKQTKAAKRKAAKRAAAKRAAARRAAARRG